MSASRQIVREARPAARVRRRRAARRARRRGLARLAVLLAVVALAVWLGMHVTTASGAAEPAVYEVRAGDTVWGIAESTYGPQTDLRRAVFAIGRVNDLREARLQPGDELVLPPEDAL